MAKDHSNKNLQKSFFKNEDLSNANFSGSDLRGANFSDANLANANLTGVKTGITPLNSVWIFLVALVISLLAGYVAMLAGETVQLMLASKDDHIRTAAYLTIVLNVFLIIYTWWKGGRTAIMNLVVPVVGFALLLGLVFNLSHLGTGMGMLYLVLAIVLLVIMLIIGTIARAAAGTVSNILFVIVALSGGMFGKSVGGGIGTVIMAIACALITKRALSGVKGFDFLRKIASFVTRSYGTSFRNAKLTNADFSRSKIRNADFTHADISSVNWGDCKKINCISSENVFTSK
jgi:hypothetical protein